MSFDENFNLAANLCEQNYDYQRLIRFLENGNVMEKQLAALEIQGIKSKTDAMILVSNLTQQDGKIREAVAFKINQLIRNDNFADFFNSEKVFEILFEGLMDINGNICRLICEICDFNNPFTKYLAKNLPQKIGEILIKIEALSADEKQYKISKRNFQLYWSLEALYYCINEVNISEIKGFLLQTGEFEDYTIREKTAKILAKVTDSKLDNLKENLKHDDNYYVRRYLI